jgi:hypothetical protein
MARLAISTNFSQFLAGLAQEDRPLGAWPSEFSANLSDTGRRFVPLGAWLRKRKSTSNAGGQPTQRTPRFRTCGSIWRTLRELDRHVGRVSDCLNQHGCRNATANAVRNVGLVSIICALACQMLLVDFQYNYMVDGVAPSANPIRSRGLYLKISSFMLQECIHGGS